MGEVAPPDGAGEGPCPARPRAIQEWLLFPTSQSISLRLPKPTLERLKQLANKRDVVYQSLLKMFVADRLKSELGPD